MRKSNASTTEDYESTKTEPNQAGRGGEDDAPISTAGEASDVRTGPRELPDTQEGLYSDNWAYRVDENEGEGELHPDPEELAAELDGLQIMTEKELRRPVD